MIRCLRTTRSARARPVGGEHRLLVLAALDEPLGLEPLQHLAGRGARDAEHLGHARGERRRAGAAGGTRRSGRRGSRSSRGTRRPECPAAIRSRIIRAAAARVRPPLQRSEATRLTSTPQLLASARSPASTIFLGASARPRFGRPTARRRRRRSARSRPGSCSSCSSRSLEHGLAPGRGSARRSAVDDGDVLAPSSSALGDRCSRAARSPG